MQNLALTIIAGLSIYYWFPALDERLAIIAVGALLFFMFRGASAERAEHQDFPRNR